MATPGELAGTGDVVCNGDGDHVETVLPLKVCKSAAGFYLGHFCPFCGPYSRESDYFAKYEDAEKALASIQATGSDSSLRDTNFKPGPLKVISIT